MIETRMRINKIQFGRFIASRREFIKEVETQELLADKLHVSTGYIGKLEAGGGLPSFELFIDLADALLMTPGELMMVMAGREGEEPLMFEPRDKETLDNIIKLVLDYVEKSPPQSPPRQQLQPYTPDAQDLTGKEEGMKIHRARSAARKKASQKENQPKKSDK